MTAEGNQSAVLIVAHGSRIAEANLQIAGVAARLGELLTCGPRVAHAFLEMARPSFAEALEVLASSGVSHVIVVPYFLAGGSHVGDDIAALVESARRRHPGVSVVVTEHFGAQARIPELLSQLVREGFER